MKITNLKHLHQIFALNFFKFHIGRRVGFPQRRLEVQILPARLKRDALDDGYHTFLNEQTRHQLICSLISFKELTVK
jgi:hypothetical protein